LVVVRLADGRRVLWNCEQKRVVADLASKEEFAPNDTIVHGFLLSEVGQTRVKVWRLDTGELTGVFSWPREGFRSPSDITLAQDGKLLVFGNQQSVQFFGADGSRRELSPMNADHTPVLSPDQRWLAVFAWHDARKRSPSILERLRLAKPPERWTRLTLYSLEDGQERATFPRGNAACFTTDSQILLVLDEKGMLQLWDVPPGRPWNQIAGYAGVVGLVGVVVGTLLNRRRRDKPTTETGPSSAKAAISP
jgi:hypothetical protein